MSEYDFCLSEWWLRRICSESSGKREDQKNSPCPTKVQTITSSSSFHPDLIPDALRNKHPLQPLRGNDPPLSIHPNIAPTKNAVTAAMMQELPKCKNESERSWWKRLSVAATRVTTNAAALAEEYLSRQTDQAQEKRWKLAVCQMKGHDRFWGVEALRVLSEVLKKRILLFKEDEQNENGFIIEDLHAFFAVQNHDIIHFFSNSTSKDILLYETSKEYWVVKWRRKGNEKSVSIGTDYSMFLQPPSTRMEIVIPSSPSSEIRDMLEPQTAFQPDTVPMRLQYHSFLDPLRGLNPMFKIGEVPADGECGAWSIVASLNGMDGDDPLVWEMANRNEVIHVRERMKETLCALVEGGKVHEADVDLAQMNHSLSGGGWWGPDEWKLAAETFRRQIVVWTPTHGGAVYSGLFVDPEHIGSELRIDEAFSISSDNPIRILLFQQHYWPVFRPAATGPVTPSTSPPPSHHSPNLFPPISPFPSQTPGNQSEIAKTNRIQFEKSFGYEAIEIMKRTKTKKEKWCMGESLIYFGTKKEIWQRMEKELGVRISYSNFCHKSRDLRKAKRGVDLCNMCMRLDTLKRREREKGFLMKKDENERDLLIEHQKEAVLMRAAFHNDIDTMKVGDVVALLDFKQDWEIPISRMQACRDFYHRQSITHLGIIVYTLEKDANGDAIKRKCSFHFLSETMSKDIRFIEGCLYEAIGSVVGVESDVRKQLKVWVDTGTHFRNGYFLNMLFGEDPTTLRHRFAPTLNFFAEGHGKSECDGEFGVLSTTLNRKVVSVRTIDQLKEFFDKHCAQTEIKRDGLVFTRKFLMFVVSSLTHASK